MNDPLRFRAAYGSALSAEVYTFDLTQSARTENIQSKRLTIKARKTKELNWDHLKEMVKDNQPQYKSEDESAEPDESEGGDADADAQIA